MEEFHRYQPFPLENGQILEDIRIGYHTYGNLNAAADNVVWICHALTANSDVVRWWPGMVGEHRYINPEKHFIVCANILGSCYGSSGPLTENVKTGNNYFSTFPQITIRDMVKAHRLLCKHLGIQKIKLCLGGSMGGYQVLEWALEDPDLFDKLFLIATSAAESAWGVAIHTAQRLAIEADPTWRNDSPDAGAKGLKAARAIGMLTYRNYKSFVATQRDEEPVLDTYKAETYIHHQGNKLVKRFNAQSYHLLTRAMDSHHIGRGRGSLESALETIHIPTLVIGISSDLLCPVEEQRFIAAHIPGAVFHEIDSPYGHDGFLIEGEKITAVLETFLK